MSQVLESQRKEDAAALQLAKATSEICIQQLEGQAVLSECENEDMSAAAAAGAAFVLGKMEQKQTNNEGGQMNSPESSDEAKAKKEKKEKKVPEGLVIPPKKPVLSKAERRALQEQQRSKKEQQRLTKAGCGEGENAAAVVFEKMGQKQIWFTADTHFGHKNILKFSNRPFASVEEMDEALIERWNEKVAPSDDVYHLGDFALTSAARTRSILEKLNGNIHLIIGNHDASALKCVDRFVWAKDYHELVVPDRDSHGGKRTIVLLHYAMRVWNASHHGSWHLYGHSHGDLPDDVASLSFDAGVDCHEYYPISYQQVKVIMSQKKWVPPFAN